MSNVSLAAWHLGAELRELREKAGVSNKEMAWELQCTAGTLGNYESGRTIARAPVIGAICEHTKAPRSTRTYLTGLSRQCTDARGEGLQEDTTQNIHPDLRCLARAEQEYGALAIWEPLYIPGLLQTESYHRALADAEGALDDSEVLPMWKVKEGRQLAHSNRQPAPKTTFVIGEPAIWNLKHLPDGDDQYSHLLKFSKKDAYEIRILSGMHPGMRGGFFVLHPGKATPKTPGPAFAYYESLHTAYYVTRKDLVQKYSATFDAMAKQATPLLDWNCT